MVDRIGPSRETMDKYIDICTRASKMGICTGNLIDAIMDVESADLAFRIRLDEWLAADDENFSHDFLGIRANIVRDGFPATEFGMFVPRYAGRE